MLSGGCPYPATKNHKWFAVHLRQHRTIPALRLKHRSGSCGTASALPKCSIMSGCGTRIVLRFAVSATGGAHLCSIQYYLRFWLSSCRTSLAVSALRIMRYCLRYNTIPQIQKACAFSTFVGREITCFILFYCFRYLSGNFQRALNAVDQVAEQPNDHAALAP